MLEKRRKGSLLQAKLSGRGGERLSLSCPWCLPLVPLKAALCRIPIQPLYPWAELSNPSVGTWPQGRQPRVRKRQEYVSCPHELEPRRTSYRAEGEENAEE